MTFAHIKYSLKLTYAYLNEYGMLKYGTRIMERMYGLERRPLYKIVFVLKKL